MDAKTKENLKMAGRLGVYFMVLGGLSYGWVLVSGKIKDEVEEEVLKLRRLNEQ